VLSDLLQWLALFFEPLSPSYSVVSKLVVTVGLTVVSGAAALYVISLVVTHYKEIIAYLVAALPYLVPLLLLIVFLDVLMRRAFRHEFVFELAATAWLPTDPTWSIWRRDADRQRLVRMMMELGQPEAELPASVGDPDISTSNAEAVPVTPGITELTLSTHEDVLAEMKRRLVAVGKFHWRLAITGSAAFFASLVFVLYAAVFLQRNVYSSLFGGLGLGALLGTFTFLTLKNVRTSNIALSLFESYLIELHERLREAGLSIEPEQRSKLRSEAWADFRRGLNALWRAEREDKSQVGTRTAQRTKRGI
jgi:hypothetical protein